MYNNDNNIKLTWVLIWSFGSWACVGCRFGRSCDGVFSSRAGVVTGEECLRGRTGPGGGGYINNDED